ncbi:MAG: hypothetical protein GY714_20085 [Desulfobacterales bacterium]|nr:hypothetical protein [Desulfobacterales bacterium]
MYDMIAMVRIEYWLSLTAAFMFGFAVTTITLWRLDRGINKRRQNET